MKKLFLIGAVILGLSFTACKDNNDPDLTPKARTTHMSVALRLGGNFGGSKAPAALPDDYNHVGTWAGQDKISTVTIYLVDNDPSVPVQSDELAVSTAYTVTPGSGTAVTLTPRKEGAIKTSPGKKTVYVVLNETPEVKAHLNTPYPAEFVKRYTETALELANSGFSSPVKTSVSKLASSTVDATGYDNIVMTNVPGTTLEVTVTEGISADETTAAATPQNRASVSVERAVSRVMITASLNTNAPSTDTYTVGTIGTISEVTWSLAQGEKALFVQRKTTYNTPWHAWVPNNTTEPYINGQDGAWGKYDYSGLYESSAVPALSAYKALGDAGVVAADVLASMGLDLNAVNGKFLLPTTHEYSADIENGNYKKGNTAYVLVRNKFTPASFADGGTPDTDGTFYYGGLDHLFYTTAQAAYDAKNTAIAKYDKGKTIYYAWINPDELPDWKNSPVLRNNIYHVHITGFKNLGLNWNPLFPENPDDPRDPLNPNPKTNDPENNPDDPAYDPTGKFENPDPKVPIIGEIVDGGGGTVDPDEPVNPIDPEEPLTNPETWMSVDVTILPWNVHSYQVDLGI